MRLRDFRAALTAADADHQIEFGFSSGETLSPHFHVTEVGNVKKDFVDCGGSRSMTEVCMLQTLVANDTHHRLTAGKLATIIDKASVLGLHDDIMMEAEVQHDTISIYSVKGFSRTDAVLRFELTSKQTACLAPEKCKLDVLPVLGDSVGTDCGGESDCC